MNNLTNTLSDTFGGMLGGLLGKLKPGMCRLSIDGNIAVNTSQGYKSYNLKTGRLTKSGNFALDVGSEYFFVVPATKVTKGNIIISRKGDKIVPRCVIDVIDDNSIKVINYEDSTIETIVPERHVFMGNTYFYGVVCSPFANMFKKSGKNNIMKFMMMSSLFGNNGGFGGDMFSLMMMSGMMNGGSANPFGDMFGGMFDFDFDFGFNTTDSDVVDEPDVTENN